MNNIYHFAQTNFREIKLFGIKEHDLKEHLIVFGDNQNDKVVLLYNLITQATEKSRKILILDTNGLLKELEGVFQSSERKSHELNMNPFLLKSSHGIDRSKVAGKIFSEFLSLDETSFESRLISMSCNLAFKVRSLDLGDIFEIILDESKRSKLLSDLDDSVLEKFWLDTFEDLSDFDKRKIKDKFSHLYAQFKSSALNQNFFNSNVQHFLHPGDESLYIDLSDLNDRSSILFVMKMIFLNLALTFDNAGYDFVFVNELDFDINEFIYNFLHKASLHGSGFVLSAKDPYVLKSAGTHVGSIISFKTAQPDALDFLAEYFYPTFSKKDISLLKDREIYLRLVIDGNLSKAFSAKVMDYHVGVKSGSGLDLPGANLP